MEEAQGVVAKSLATFLPASQRPSKRPESARRLHEAACVPEASAAPKFPPPPVPTTLPVPARKYPPSNFLQMPEQDAASCRSASSGAGTRTSQRSFDTSIVNPGSSRRRTESSGCLRKTSRRTPRAPRWNDSTKCEGFPDMEEPLEMPTLRAAWESGPAIGGTIPGCGGNPLGGAARKPSLASNLDYRKALSYERVAHRVEKQMHERHSSKPRSRPNSAEILKMYPEAARVMQNVV